MAQEFSFDVVSKVDLQAVDNAVNSALREITTRFDFKGSVSRLALDKKANTLTLYSDNDGKLKSVVDILQNRLIKQNISSERPGLWSRSWPRKGGPSAKWRKLFRAWPRKKPRKWCARSKTPK
jgi:uncharacterized protein YajQ (UPF0234 family)